MKVKTKKRRSLKAMRRDNILNRASDILLIAILAVLTFSLVKNSFNLKLSSRDDSAESISHATRLPASFDEIYQSAPLDSDDADLSPGDRIDGADLTQHDQHVQKKNTERVDLAGKAEDRIADLDIAAINRDHERNAIQEEFVRQLKVLGYKTNINLAERLKQQDDAQGNNAH